MKIYFLNIKKPHCMKDLTNYLLSKIEKRCKYKLEWLPKKSHIDIFNKNYNLNLIFIIKISFQKFRDFFQKKKKQKHFPLFIIGLTRSCSTLVETILSSNNKIKSLGENSVINMAILNQVSHKIFDKNFDKKNFQFSIDCSKL